MNTETLPHFPPLSRNLKSRTAILSLAACLSMISPATCRAMEAIDALSGLAPMNAAELEESYGGFMLPNGTNINIGIETDISVNGNLVVRNYYSSGKFNHTPSTDNKPATFVNIEQQATTTKIYHPASSAATTSPEGNTTVTFSDTPLTGGVQTIVSNTANNAIISQVQKITIDISNYAALVKQQAASALAILGSQARAGAISAIR